MILGESAFIYRKTGTQTYLSAGLVQGENVEPIHVDVAYVDANNVVSHKELHNWRPEFGEATFELEDGQLIAKREIEKMSKSKYNVVNPDDISYISKRRKLPTRLALMAKCALQLTLMQRRQRRRLKKLHLPTSVQRNILMERPFEKVIVVPKKIVNIVCG